MEKVLARRGVGPKDYGSERGANEELAGGWRRGWDGRSGRMEFEFEFEFE